MNQRPESFSLQTFFSVRIHIKTGSMEEEPYVDLVTVERLVSQLRSGKIAKVGPIVSRRSLVAAEPEGLLAPDVVDGDNPPLPSYSAMLTRAYSAVHASRPMTTSKTLAIPKFCRVGGAHTGWQNFEKTCRHLERPCDHVALFFSVELATTTTVNPTSGMVVRGRLDEKTVGFGLHKYVARYVECGGVVEDITGKKANLRGCRSWHTDLFFDKKLRLWRLRCRDCGCEVTVPALVAGYRAVTKTDRRAQKAERGGF